MKSFNYDKSIRERVAFYLEKDRKMNDTRLIKNIWYQDLIYSGYSAQDAINIVSTLNIDQLTNPETIRRTRQKLQQENPDMYGVGDHHKEKIVREQFK